MGSGRRKRCQPDKLFALESGLRGLSGNRHQLCDQVGEFRKSGRRNDNGVPPPGRFLGDPAETALVVLFDGKEEDFPFDMKASLHDRFFANPRLDEGGLYSLHTIHPNSVGGTSAAAASTPPAEAR